MSRPQDHSAIELASRLDLVLFSGMADFEDTRNLIFCRLTDCLQELNDGDRNQIRKAIERLEARERLVSGL